MTPRRRRWVAALVGAAVGLGVGSALLALQGGAPPALAVTVVGQREVSPGLWRPVAADALRPGDRVSVRIRPERPAHVYVLSDGPDGLRRLFPAAGPARLAAGETLVLPGRARGYGLGPRPVHLVVVRSAKADPALEGSDPSAWRSRLARLGRASLDPTGPWDTARLGDGRRVPVRSATAREPGVVRVTVPARAPAATPPRRTPRAPPAG